jgi:hypothetical protein
MIHSLADVAEQAVDTDRMEWKRWDSRQIGAAYDWAQFGLLPSAVYFKAI